MSQRSFSRKHEERSGDCGNVLHGLGNELKSAACLARYFKCIRRIRLNILSFSFIDDAFEVCTLFGWCGKWWYLTWASRSGYSAEPLVLGAQSFYRMAAVLSTVSSQRCAYGRAPTITKGSCQTSSRTKSCWSVKRDRTADIHSDCWRSRSVTLETGFKKSDGSRFPHLEAMMPPQS